MLPRLAALMAGHGRRPVPPVVLVAENSSSLKKFGGAQEIGISPYTDTRPSSPIPPRGWGAPERVVSRVKADTETGSNAERPRPPVLVRGRSRRYLLRHTALTIDTPPALSVLAVVLVAAIVGAGGTAILLPR